MTIDTGKFTTLKLHSEGNKYQPVNEDGRWHLKNQSGQYLAGNAGGVYNFITEQNAITWLDTNLLRLANKTNDIDIDYLKKVGQSYRDHGYELARVEFESIAGFNDNEWRPVPNDYSDCSADGEQGGYVYSRPNDWLALPDNQAGVDKISILIKVLEEKPDVYLYLVQGSDFTIDWGDGTTDSHLVEKYEINHTYANPSALADLPYEDGYRQAVVTITPNNGGSITALQYTAPSNWQHRPKSMFMMDIRINCPSLSNLKLSYLSNNNTGYKRNLSLRHAIIGENALTSWYQVFLNAEVLEYLKFEDGALDTATSINKMCLSNYRLALVEGLTAPLVTNADEAFKTCVRLERVEGEGLPSCSNYKYTFYDCRILHTVFSKTSGHWEFTYTGAVGDISLKQLARNNIACESINLNFTEGVTLSDNEQFREMRGLKRISSTNNIKIKNLVVFAYYCTVLEDLEDLKVTSVIDGDLGNGFRGTNLKQVPSWLNLNNFTLLDLAFYDTGIMSMDTLTFSQDVNLSQAVTGGRGLTISPEIILTNGAVITNGAQLFHIEDIVKLSPLDVSKVIASFHGNFAHRRSLRIVDYYNIDKSMTFTNAPLDADELNKIFNNLLPTTDQTITITGCLGANDCDTTIATAKGWTVAV